MGSSVISDELGVPSLVRAKKVLATMQAMHKVFEASATEAEFRLVYERRMAADSATQESMMYVRQREARVLWDAVRIIDDWIAQEEMEQGLLAAEQADEDRLSDLEHDRDDYGDDL